VKQEGPYNPLDKLNLGNSVAEALLEQPAHPLPPGEPFDGAGVYAIYYTGDFAPYRTIAIANRGGKLARPIYVGKAVPGGARKGLGEMASAAETSLYRRLREHAKSIEQARNLDIADFMCRWLVVDDIWIPLGESLLVRNLSPIWNQAIDGFGNHPPGSGRSAQARSPWDVLHPGRPWADTLSGIVRTEKQILDELASFLRATGQR